jgi:hypothetical protein
MAERKPVRGATPAPVTLQINRAPVLTLWAAVVAERLGYDPDEAATLGRAVAGLNAASQARRLGLRDAGKEPASPAARRPRASAADVVALLGRHVPVVRTKGGLRAAREGKPDDPAAVQRYLAAKFGDGLAPARAAMVALAASFGKSELAADAFALYERFRPTIPAGAVGWGAKGVLDLAAIRALARRR